MAIGGYLPDIVSSVVGREGANPLVGMPHEVFGAKVSACLLAKGDDLFGDWSSIEIVRPVLRDVAIGLGQTGISKQIAGFRSLFSAPQKGLLGVFPSREGLLGFSPVSRDDRRDSESIFGQCDGWFENLRHAEFTKFTVQVVPPCNATRDTPGEWTIERDLLELLFCEDLSRQFFRCPAAGVQT
jgi:hypothetical protein